MTKTFKDYLLDGGVKGKIFHHRWPDSLASFFYTIEDIDTKRLVDSRDHGRYEGMLFYSRFGTKGIESIPIREFLTDKEATKEQLAESKIELSSKKVYSSVQ